MIIVTVDTDSEEYRVLIKAFEDHELLLNIFGNLMNYFVEYGETKPSDNSHVTATFHLRPVEAGKPGQPTTENLSIAIKLLVGKLDEFINLLVEHKDIETKLLQKMRRWDSEGMPPTREA